MSHFLTANQAARQLADGFERQTGARPSITAQKVEALVHTGVLENVNPSGERILISRDQVADFLDRTTYVPDYAAFGIQDPIFRVSVVEQRENPVYDLSGDLLRQYSGFDYANRDSLTEEEQRGGFEGAWSISDDNAEYLVETNGYLLPTTKGYVRADNIRRITDFCLAAGTARKFFFTEALDDNDPFYADAANGFWIDVPPGRESNLDFDPPAAEGIDESIDQESIAQEGGSFSEDGTDLSLDELIELKLQQIRQLDDLIARKEAEEELEAQDEDNA